MTVGYCYFCCGRWYYVCAILLFWVCCKNFNSCVFLCLVTILVTSTNLSRPGLVERYCFDLVLSRHILVSPFMVVVNFAVYSVLCWHSYSLRILVTSVQDLLAFRVSVEKSGIILMGLPLYLTRPLSLIA